MENTQFLINNYLQHRNATKQKNRQKLEKIPEIEILIGKHFINRFQERFDKQNKIENICVYLNGLIQESFINKYDDIVIIPKSGVSIPVIRIENKIYLAKTFEYSLFLFDTTHKQIKIMWKFKIL